MEATIECYDRCAAGSCTNNFQRILCCLGATVGQHATDRIGHGDEIRKSSHQFLIGLVRHRIECVVRQPRDLFADGFDNPWVAVT
ncbi:hypothetical protein D3C71_1893300 [compost metagenome]